MKLQKLIKSAGLYLPVGSKDFEVKGITSDSRAVMNGFIFVAIKGAESDGHRFISHAIQKGAKAIVIQCPWPRLPALVNPVRELPRRSGGLKGGRCKGGYFEDVVYIRVNDTRRALADLSAAFWGHPSSLMKLVGITGTNGKTTVSYLIEAILKYAHYSPAVIGTVNYRFKNKIFKAVNTTPDSSYLQALLAKMHKSKVDYVIIEVSSHALDQDRARSAKFSTGIFTNLSVDHLDYHRDLDSYFLAKARLFKNLPKKGAAILNIDDGRAAGLIKLTKAYVVTYGLRGYADVSAQDVDFSLKGTEFILHLSSSIRKKFASGNNEIKMSLPLIGEYNIYNALAAIAFGLTQKIELKTIRTGLERFSGVPGRLEKVRIKKDFSVFVDYAHTEDALRNVIMSLRPLCKGRIYVVFGCGGGRDRSKRPKMGQVVSELADFAIITTDNPRSENPGSIIDEVVSGIDKKNYRVILDRRDAIKEALSISRKDDIILVAGKGHERYQIFKDRIAPFDDREVVRECLGLG
ncbi:MAG: UDP-N-acetylmuramoyl-L-alanyl-D-glutamate--2,6-diaminopimelate ligase [Candidatus Omnitrophota bacterium]